MRARRSSLPLPVETTLSCRVIPRHTLAPYMQLGRKVDSELSKDTMTKRERIGFDGLATLGEQPRPYDAVMEGDTGKTLSTEPSR